MLSGNTDKYCTTIVECSCVYCTCIGDNVRCWNLLRPTSDVNVVSLGRLKPLSSLIAQYIKETRLLPYSEFNLQVVDTSTLLSLSEQEDRPDKDQMRQQRRQHALSEGKITFIVFCLHDSCLTCHVSEFVKQNRERRNSLPVREERRGWLSDFKIKYSFSVIIVSTDKYFFLVPTEDNNKTTKN